MPKTTISVIFNGKDNGLTNLFNTLDKASSSLEQNLRKLESALDGVDQKLKSIKSNSSALSGLKIPALPQQAQAKSPSSSLGGSAVSNMFSGISTSASMLGNVLNTTGSLAKTIFSGVTSAITGSISGAYANITNMIKYVDKAVLVFGNSVRQIAQGIQSFGIAFSIFVSAPIAGMLKGVVSESIDFDDALNKVRKTTSSTQESVEKLGEGITKLSLGMPQTRIEMAKIAEDWGSIGAKLDSTQQINAMTELTRLTAMLVDSTEGLTSDNVVEKLGRLAAIYYPDVASFTDEAAKLFSVIGALEDANSIDAGELLATMQRLAPVAKTLKIPIEAALAMSASLASVNASAERAGTQGATALSQMAINADKVAELFGITEAEVAKMVDTAPDEFFYTIAASIGALDSATQQVTVSTDIFGTTGAKAFLSTMNSMDNLSKNLNIANSEFAKGTYLQYQFAAALDSSKNQLAILRNNVTYAGSAIGDALLPYITKFVVLAVPAIQMLTEWFKSLGESIKLQVVGWMLLLAVAGPIVVFFSSLLFMVGLSISGLASLFSVVGMIVQGFVGFAGAVFALLSPVNLLVAALAGVAIYAVYLTNDLLMAQGIVQSYVSKFYSWGYNLITSFADGIASAGTAAYNAVMSVINAFIGLIQAFSPPKKGPLKDISKWGKGVMEAFADGIRSGGSTVAGVVSLVNESLKTILTGFDLSTIGTFTDAFSAIKSTISSVAAHIGLTSEDTNVRITAASNALALFIQNMKAGIPDDLKEIAGFLGGLGGDFENLISLQLTYSNGAQRLNEIALALKGINAETDKMIADVVTQTGLTNEQQSAMIRKIKLEQSLKEQSLTAEQNALQLQQDQLKNDIDKKQEIINILSGLIMPADSVAGAIDPATGKPKAPKEEKPGITPIDMVPFTQASGAIGKLDEKFKAAGESAKTFTEKLGAAKLMIEGFVAAIRGDDAASYSKMPDEFWLGWTKGATVRAKVMEFLTKLETGMQKIKDMKAMASDAFFAYLVGYNTGASGGELNWDIITYMNSLSVAATILGFAVGQAAKSVKGGFDYIFKGDGTENTKTPFEILMDRILESWKAFKTGWDAETKDLNLSAVATAFGDLGVAVGGLSTTKEVWGAIGHLLGGIAFAATRVVTGLALMVHWIAAIFGVGDQEKFAAMYTAFYDTGKGASKLATDARRAYTQIQNIRQGFIDAKQTLSEWVDFILGTNYSKADEKLNGKPKEIKGMAAGDLATDWQTQIDNAEAGADKVSDAYIKQLNANFAGVGTRGDIAQNLANMFSNGTLDIEESVKTNGDTTAGTFLDNIKAALQNPVKLITVFGVLPVSIETWRAGTGKPLLETNGKSSGGDVLEGIRIKFEEDVAYMGQLITSIGIWITENFKLIVDQGASFGSQIITGITNSLASAGDAMWQALQGALQAVYDNLPDWFLILIGQKKPDKKDDGTKSKPINDDAEVVIVEPERSKFVDFDSPSLPSGATSNSQSLALTINIDNSGGGSITRQTVDYLVDKVYARLIKDTRLLG